MGGGGRREECVCYMPHSSSLTLNTVPSAIGKLDM